MRTGQLDQILESISALALSFAILQVQADREQRLPPQSTPPTAPIRQVPTQACQAGPAGTPRSQGNPTSHPAPIQTVSVPALPPAPTQSKVRTSDTVAGVAATTPDLSVLGFPGVFTFLKAGAHTTPQVRI